MDSQKNSFCLMYESHTTQKWENKKNDTFCYEVEQKLQNCVFNPTDSHENLKNKSKKIKNSFKESENLQKKAKNSENIYSCNSPFASENLNSSTRIFCINEALNSNKNLNFIDKNVPFIPDYLKKKDSDSTWAVKKSVFLGKIGNNSDWAEKRMDKFNDSTIFSANKKNFHHDNNLN